MANEPDPLTQNDGAPKAAGGIGKTVLRGLAIVSAVVMMLGLVVGITRLFVAALIVLLICVLVLYLRREK
jgi:hypothetical protein